VYAALSDFISRELKEGTVVIKGKAQGQREKRTLRIDKSEQMTLSYLEEEDTPAGDQKVEHSSGGGTNSTVSKGEKDKIIGTRNRFRGRRNEMKREEGRGESGRERGGSMWNVTKKEQNRST